MTTAKAASGRGAATCLLAVVLVVALLPGGTPAAAQSAWPAGAVPGALLVTGTAEAEALARAARVPATARDLSDRVVLVEVAAGDEAVAAEALRDMAGVVAVEPDRLRRYQRRPDDPGYAVQWAHAQSGAEAAWDVTTGAQDVLVAVVDSGVRGDHPDLAVNVVEQVDVSTGVPVPVGPGVDNDRCADGHGTAVAGVLGAVGDNGLDVAGVAWSVGIVDIAVTSGGSGGACEQVADSAVIAALEYARTRSGGPVDVVNLSLGSPGNVCPLAYQTQLDAARAAGIVIVASAGNRQLSDATAGQPAVPASCRGVIAVGATGRGGGRADYSTANPWIDLVAPGGSASATGDCAAVPGDCVATLGRDGGVRFVEGTSYAAPYVAGVAALVRAARPDLPPAAVESVLERSATDLDVAGRDDGTGWGAVHAGAALALVTGPQPIPGPEPDPVFPLGRRQSAVLPAPGAGVARVWSGEVPTAPVGQAVAVSQATFADQGAAHVVLSRDDAYPDALAGSTLGLGAGPLLFTSSTDDLDERTRAEIQRVLPPGGTVYPLGGLAALPEVLENELSALGYAAHRLAGPSRVATAAAVADEVVRRRGELGVPDPGMVLLATAGDWPDAVSAGAIGASLGAPILLTPQDHLDAPTAEALARLAPPRLLVVGGQGAVADEVAEAARTAAGEGTELVRLAGSDRAATAVAVARELDRVQGPDHPPALAVAVNYEPAVDGYTHVLSASALVGAHTGVFVPLTGSDGRRIDATTAEYLRGLDRVGVVAGGPDLVADATLRRLRRLLTGR